MRLPDGLRTRQGATDAVPDPEIEAELGAIDEALAGGHVPTDRAHLAQLARELRDERAEPSQSFAEDLDRWAEQGFKRADRPGKARAATLAERLSLPTRGRLIAPAGALATLVIVAGIAISQNISSTDPDDPVTPTLAPVPEGAPNTEGGETAPSSPPAQAEDSALGLSKEPGRAADVPPDERKIARAADLVLATEPEQVQEVADGVNAVVNRHRGIVLNSSIQSGDADGAPVGAQFRLRLPTRALQPALAELSELAHVQSRTESTEDVTGGFITSQERIDELKASRESILERLADASTQEEREAIRRELRAVNSQLQAERSQLADLRDRVSFVPVTVSIISREGADDDGQWGIEEALDDAGDVLSAAAGILVVAAAVLLPLALVAAVAAFALRGWIGRGRERALDR